MTLAYSYNGGAMTHDVEPSGISIPQRADMGEISRGGIPLEDPSASLTMLGHRPFIVTESACTQQRLFTGYVAERGIGRSLDRGMFVGPDPRLHDLTIVDCNAAARFRIISGVDGNRPEETWEVRFNWILNSGYLAGLVSTSRTFTDTWPNPMDAVDYRGSFAGDVLDDLARRFEGAVNWFFFWNPGTSAVTCFMDHIDQGIANCTLRISNVFADCYTAGVPSATTFAPDSVASLAREPDQTFSEVKVDYANGSIFRSRASTATTYIRRGTSISRPYTGKASTAAIQAEMFLDAHATETDRITCSIQVPSVSVGLVQAGQLIQVKFSHMPGYAAFTWMRIVSCSPVPTNDVVAFYDVALELVGLRPLPTVPLLGELVAHASGFYGHEPPLFWPDGDEKVVFRGTGDTPPAGFPGWGNPHPISGPVEYIVHGAWAWLGFRMLANGIVDISSAGGFAGVSGGGASTTVTLRRNGAIIASQTQTDTHGSVHFWGGAFYFDETGIVALAGDEFGFGVSFAGWAGFEYYASIPADGPDLTHFFISGVAGPGGTDTIGTLPPPPLTTHTTDPTVDDDSDAGYGIGDVWVNTATGAAFVCVDNTNGAAVWTSTTAVWAPTTADYLVGTAQAGLSAEIVVGTTPGGELGGTWASPTVDPTHAGSAHLALGSTSSTAAAGDHAHAAYAGELLITDTPAGSPLVFADLLQNEAGDALLYQG